MKKSITNIFSLFLVFFLSCGSAQAALITQLEVQDSDIFVGDVFDVTVSFLFDAETELGEEAELTGFGFSVDPFASLTNLSYLGATVNSSFFDDSDTGTGYVGGFLGALTPVTDNIVEVAVLQFEAIAKGVDTITVDGLSDGLFFGAFYSTLDTFIPVDFDISGQASVDVPEPGSLSLLALGILAIAGFRKRA